MSYYTKIKPRLRRLRVVGGSLAFALDRKRSATFYPESPRKTRMKIAFELARSGFVNKIVDNSYFLYGIDRQGVLTTDFPTDRQLMDIVHRQIKTEGARKQADLLRDKQAFSVSMIGAGISSPPIVAMSEGSRVRYTNGRETSLEELARREGVPLFAKPTRGAAGRGAFRLELIGDEVMINRCPVRSEEIPQLLNEPFIFQPVIAQHAIMARLHPSSLNTMRLVTVRRGEQINVLGGFLRMGCNGAVTDKFSGQNLGIFVPLDVSSGRLMTPGYYMYADRGRPSSHPDSGVRFDGFEVPFYKECVEIAQRAHLHVGRLITVGWDVAITPDGPIIVEGNGFWQPRANIAGDPDFLARYVRVVEPWLTPGDETWASRYMKKPNDTLST